MKPKWNWFDALNALILTGVVGACLYPFVYMLAVSLSDSASIASGRSGCGRRASTWTCISMCSRTGGC